MISPTIHPQAGRAGGARRVRSFLLVLVSAGMIGGISYFALPLGIRAVVAVIAMAAVAALWSKGEMARDLSLGSALGALLAFTIAMTDPTFAFRAALLGIPGPAVTLVAAFLTGVGTAWIAHASDTADEIGNIQTLGLELIQKWALPLAVLTTVITAFSDASKASEIVGSLSAGIVSMGVAVGAGFSVGRVVGSWFRRTSLTNMERASDAPPPTPSPPDDLQPVQ